MKQYCKHFFGIRFNNRLHIRHCYHQSVNGSTKSFCWLKSQVYLKYSFDGSPEIKAID